MKTKTLLFFIGFTLFSICSFCQLPQTLPLSENNPVWLQITSYYTYYYHIVYCLHGDTLINSKIFQKIYTISDTIYNESGSSYYGAIREDDGKVYIYYASSDTRMHVATSSIDRLVDYCRNSPEHNWHSQL